jgi:hypothetical protein
MYFVQIQIEKLQEFFYSAIVKFQNFINTLTAESRWSHGQFVARTKKMSQDWLLVVQ